MHKFKVNDYVHRRDRREEQTFQIVEIDDSLDRAQLRGSFAWSERHRNRLTSVHLILLEKMTDMEALAWAAKT